MQIKYDAPKWKIMLIQWDGGSISFDPKTLSEKDNTYKGGELPF